MNDRAYWADAEILVEHGHRLDIRFADDESDFGEPVFNLSVVDRCIVVGMACEVQIESGSAIRLPAGKQFF